MNCTLHFIHHAVRERESHIDWHRHPMFEIVYYRTGDGTTAFDGKEYRYEPGSFTVIYPNVPHNEFRHTETEVIYFGFYYDNRPVELDMGWYPDPHGVILGLIEQILNEMNEQLNHYALKIDSLLQAVIIETQRLRGTKVPSYADKQIINAKHYMDQYFNQKMNLTQLSDLCGYSYDHFRHLFKSVIGMTPTQYLRQLRIEKAKKMILEQDKSLTFIALECGFTSLSQFSSAYRQITGKSPSDLREKSFKPS